MFTRQIKSGLGLLVAVSVVVASFFAVVPTSTVLAGGSQSITLTITQIDTAASWPGKSELGVAIHTRIQITGYQDVPMEVTVFFKHYSNQRWVVKSNGKYLSNTFDLTPTSNSTVWKDATFWFNYQTFYNVKRSGSAPVFYAQLQGKASGDARYSAFSSDVRFSVPVRID